MKLGIATEVGTAVVALLLAWLLGVNLRSATHFTPAAFVYGLSAVAVPLLMYLAVMRAGLKPIRRINAFLDEVLVPGLATCRWYELALLAVLAGVCEELLFRGTLQFYAEQWHPWAGIVVANVLFGMAHSVTLTYAVWAACFGLYFSFLMDLPAQRNLAIPMICHAAYDFAVFFLLIHRHRRRLAAAPA